MCYGLSVRCECHNLPKVWQTDNRKRKRGYWRCVRKHVSFRERNPEYAIRDRFRRVRSHREAVIAEMDRKISYMLDQYPFLKEVVSVED